MKNFNRKNINLKTQSTKALLLGVLTLTPILASINTAEAAPRAQAPTWNNQRFEPNRDGRRDNDQFDNGRSNSYNNGSNRGYGGYDYRQDNRHDDYPDNHRNDNHSIDYGNGNRGYSNNNSTDTKKLLGAGIIGAIIGAVIAR